MHSTATSSVLAILAFSSILNLVDSDVFTAVVKLESLVRVEQKMIDALGQYIEDSVAAKEFVPDHVKPFFTEAREQNEQALKPHFIENPLNAFHFVKRMTNWDKIFKDINCDDCVETRAIKGLTDSILEIREGAPVAAKGDLIGSAIALVRLWQTYKLDLADLFRGKIYNTSATPLSDEDIYYICYVVDDLKMYYKEILWLEELVRQVDNGYYTGAHTASRAYRALAGAYVKYGMPWKSNEILAEYLKKDPNDTPTLRDKKYYEAKVKDIAPDQRTLTLQPAEEDVKKEHYEALCRGDIKRPISITSKLKCFFKPTLSPLLFAKEEVLNYDPRVSMYYDVITEAEMQFLKDKVFSMFRRSGIVGTTSDEIHDMRVSQTAWLHDKIAPIIRKFTYRIQLFTGLSSELYETLSHAEELQILNYGIGGMYEAHPDWFGTPLHMLVERNIDPPQLKRTGDRVATWLTYGFPLRDHHAREADPPMLKGTGDRLATWLTYLNPVEAGGATVFIGLNITVPVVKGAAAFWYNMKRTGECDDRTYHAGCPVLIGSKWAANKWFRENGNMFRRPCGKSTKTLDKPLH